MEPSVQYTVNNDLRTTSQGIHAMKAVYYNGNVYVNRDRFATAFIIDNGFFTFVGSDEEAFSKVDDDVMRIDLQSHTVVPGFNDSHLHFYYMARALRSVNLAEARSIEDVIAIGRSFLEHNPSISILSGRGWNQDYFLDEVRLLTRYDLDRISTTIPIIFTRACGHVVSANSLALEKAKVDVSSFVEGGEVGVEHGALTGVLSENAIVLLDPLKTNLSVDEVLDDLHYVSKVANSCGITSVQTNDLRVGDDDSAVIEEAYRRYALDQPTVRIYHQVCFNNIASFKERIVHGYHCDTNDYNRYGPLKVFVDGSLGARTAYLRQPYHDDPSTYGLPTLTQSEINEYARVAQEGNIQMAMHAIGDGAMTSVLDAYEALDYSANTLRHGIVHCQITDMVLLQRCKDLDIVAYVQPIFLHYDLHIVQERVGQKLAATSYAFHAMDELGMHVAYGTDSPVEPFDVMNCLHCAVNRMDLNNEPAGGFIADQKVSIQQAIDNYTMGSAYASFEEDRKGRILPDYFADFVVLSENIFQIDALHIKHVHVVMTAVGGRVVYQKVNEA